MMVKTDIVHQLPEQKPPGERGLTSDRKVRRVIKFER